MTNKNKSILLVACIVVICILFIWGQSLIPFGESTQISSAFNDYVKLLVDSLFGKGTFTPTITRKFAHFVEYFILGIFLTFLVWLYQNLKQKSIYFGVAVCNTIAISCALALAIACIDEFLQSFTDRHPQILDVCIDFGGAIFAILLVAIILTIIRGIRNWKTKKNNT